MNIEELSTASGVSVRAIKHYISLGLVAPAIGRTRNARYSKTHLDDLSRIKLAQEQGQRVSRLAKSPGAKAMSAQLPQMGGLNLLVYPIAEHAYLVVDQGRVNLSVEDQRVLVEVVRKAAIGVLAH